MLQLIKKAKLFFATVGMTAFLSSPLPIVNGETIALWDFDETTGAVIADSVTVDAVDGEISTGVQNVTSTVFGSGFGNARDFSTLGSYASLGDVYGSKIDLTGITEVAIEASIYLTDEASSPAIIFDNRQLQLQVINNRLAGYVRQGTGFRGTVSSFELQVETPYHVGAHLFSGHLVLTVDGRVVANVKILESIAPAEISAQAFIGGRDSGMNFPGIIDNVRLSNAVHFDTIPPTIDIISPDVSAPLISEYPELVFEILDNEGQIDESSIVVKLNGNVVSGLSFDDQSGELSGQLEAPLVSGLNNLIDIEVKDAVGNDASAQFQISYIEWGSGSEYESDEHTLGLWHMNDTGAGWVTDASNYARHGRQNGTVPVLGVLGHAYQFRQTSLITLPPVPIPGSVFTFEAWVQPHLESSAVGTIFDNGQVSIGRDSTNGAVRVVLRDYIQSYTYNSDVGALPVGEWSHLKVVYDGNFVQGNLLVLVNGLIVSQLNAIYNCDFDDIPQLGSMGGIGWSGSIDEVRLSSIIRESINVIRGNPPTISIGFPSQNQTVSSDQLNLHATLSDELGIDPEDIEVILNGVVQVPSTGFVVTSNLISGVLPSALHLGTNDIEIKVKGESGNQTIVHRKVHYISSVGFSEYTSDTDTVALWHFNENSGTTSFDVSGNDYHINSTSSVFVTPGVFGNSLLSLGSARSVNGISFPGKNFTVDGWIKVSSFSGTNRPLWSLSRASFQAALSVTNNNLEVSMILPGNPSFQTTIYNVVPSDEFFHVAWIYDADITHANFKLLINGNVVFTHNLRSYCNVCASDLTFSIGGASNIAFDEFRISKVARSEFNTGSGLGPDISYAYTEANDTVHTAQPEFLIYFADEVGIDVNTMSLEVNGVADSSLSSSVSGSLGFLSGALSLSLNPGTNVITVRGKNQNGQETVESFYVYYIAQGPQVEYASDLDTMGLWHFNAGTAIQNLSDSSGRNFNFTGVASPVIVPGAFNGALSSTGFLNLNATAAAETSVQKVTFEMWLKVTNQTNFNFSLNFNTILSVSSTGAVSYGFSGGPTTPSGTIPNDGEFHHVAVIADNSNPYHKVYLVVNGKVVHTTNPTSFPSFVFSSAQSTVAYAQVDEIRVSKEPRYTLSFSKPSSLLFMRAAKAIKKRK